MEILHEDLVGAALKLYNAMIISCVQLMMPINFLTEMYFLHKTNRQNLGVSVIFYIEFALFFAVLKWIHDWNRLQYHDYTNDYFDHEEKFGETENFMMNVMW